MARFTTFCITTFLFLFFTFFHAPLARADSTTCYAHIDPASDFTSQDSAAALRQAIVAASPNSLVKAAGSCAGAIAESAGTQVAIINKALTLRGGYTVTNWVTSDPIANPTVLDAQNGGRVLNITVAGVTIENVTLTGGNVADSNGGGGLLSSQPIKLNQVNVVSNTTTSSGGGITVNGSGITQIVGGRFERNRAASNGGGINIAGTLFMTQSQVLSNTVTGGAGGGAYVGGSVRLSGILFQGNQANGNTGNGGGLFVAGSNNNTLNYVDFLNNQAGVQGGGAYLSAATQVVGGSLIDNRASSNGGGIATLQQLTINNTRLIGNLAQQDGGAIYYGYFSASNTVNHQLVNTLLARNTSGRNGAAAYVALLGNSLEILHTTIVTPTAASGAAIYQNNGSVRITNTLFANYNTGIQRIGGSASEEYNLFFGVSTPTQGTVLTSTHRVTGDPLFVNMAGDNYHLSVGSAAMNQGLDKGIPTDIDSDARPFSSAPEIGYDEFIDTPISGLSLLVLANPTHLDDSTALQTSLGAGDYVRYTLDFGDGTTTSAPQFLPGQVIALHHTYAAVGHYTAILTATNIYGSVSKSVTVQVINDAPQADAGNNLNAPVASTVQLNGLGSSDSDGDLPLQYHWVQTGGETVTLNQPNTATPSFLAPVTPDNLTFALIVTDSHGLAAVAADEVMVHVRDVAITGLMTQNSAPTQLGKSTYFTATRMAGSNVVHTWDFGDGTTVNSQQSTVNSHTYTEAGLYTTIVTATNSESTVIETMDVQVINDPPQADAGADQETWVGNSVTLEGSASSDPNENIPLSYAWTQTGGTPVTLDNALTVQPSFTAPMTPGVLTFTLMVTDSHAMPALAADQMVVRVRDVAIQGFAVEDSAPTRLGESTFFTATHTAGSNVVHTWNFGDGMVVTSQESADFGELSRAVNSHTYATAGVYTVIVTATNSENMVSTAINVQVINHPPQANAGVDQEVVVGANVTLDGSASSDPNGNIPLAYGWTQTGGATVALNTATSVQPSFIAPATPSLLTFALMVTDSQGMPAIAADEVVIRVHDVAITNLTLQSSAPTSLSQATSFTVTQSSGSNILYSWNFGDGATVNSQQSALLRVNSHTYAAAGNYTVIVTATNGEGNQVATTGILVVNLAPVAEDDSYLLSEDQSLNVAAVGIKGNDSDANQQPLQVEVAQLPTHGTLRLNVDGSFVYTPQANYNGNDSFIYLARDPGGLTDNAIVTLMVQPVNDAPTANPQSFNTAANQSVTLTLSGADVDGNPLSFAIVMQPRQGLLAGAAPNLTYTPVITASGVDSFTFQVCDNAALPLCAQAVVSFTITPVASDLPPIFLSSQQSGAIGNFYYRDEDILRYDRSSNQWTMIFDGSNLGLGCWDVDAFAFQSDATTHQVSILMSFSMPIILPTLGWVNDNDIVRFTPTSLGHNNTRGTFTWFLRGWQVGLNSANEDIDGIDFDQTGRLLVSVMGNFKATGVLGKDEDIFALNNGVFGTQSSGTWVNYFKGSRVGLTQEHDDILDSWSDPATGELYLSSKQSFTAPNGFVVAPGEIVICSLTGYGDQTACNFRSFWKGSTYGWGNAIIDGLHVGAPANLNSLLANSSVGSASLDENEEIVGEDANNLHPADEEIEETGSEENEEGSTNAREEEMAIKQLFLPITNR